MEKITFKSDLFIGENALDRLCEFKNEKIFIIADRFITNLGIIEAITTRITEHNTFFVFNDISPKPQIEHIIASIAALNEFDGTMLLAIGSCAAIDTAKGVKFFGQKCGTLKAMPFVVIPTADGNTSEAASLSVVEKQTETLKYPVVTDAILPDETILDTALIQMIFPKVESEQWNVPHQITAYSAKNGNQYSKAFG
ncbi:iron-containing alcohol dehydrogenase [Brochothrix thermosphacta]|uniref:iron-containing alcohol dehydrogenase n=1 Tax=Brochothrix thermosphacta TaxID=2756 RepID=UPI000D0F895E